MTTSDPLTPAGRSKLAPAAAFVLFAAITASVTLGPQLAVWPSAPALVALALATLLALPISARLPASVTVTGAALVGWLAYRCFSSPVVEFAIADGMLLTSCVAAFWVTRAILGHRGGLEILFSGLGVLVLANWWPMILQSKDPSQVLWLPRGTESFPSGFFAYYGDCAAFLAGMALLAGGLVWDGRRAPWFRIFMAVVAVAAAAGVVFSKSRGGIIGLGAGALLLLALAPWLTLKRGSRWLGVVALLLPVMLIAGVILIGDGLAEAQKLRDQTGTTTRIFDNAARLFWWKLAAACIGLHPWLGGGSRSYSWENLRFWEGGWTKFSDAEPEFTHNELIQMTADYGIVGLLLLVVFLGAVVVAGIVARWNGEAAKAGTAVFLAGLAALSALLIHGCFHFVFHLPPAAMLLGVALAGSLETTRDHAASRSRWRFPPSALIPAACIGVLGFFGFKAIKVFREMAPLVYRFGDAVPGRSDAFARIGEAARVWPGHSLHIQQGKLALTVAAKAGGEERQMLLESAESSFREATAAHPFDAEASVNLANVLGSLGRDEEAEREFERANDLQGGVERGFRVRFSWSSHLFRQALRLRRANQMDEALAAMTAARDRFDEGASPSAWEYGDDGRSYRIALSLDLGPWHESLGRHEDAAAEYDRMAKVPGADGIHFLAARNLTAWGDSLWARRQPEAALRKFMDARLRLNQARGIPPFGSTTADLTELAERLRGKVTFLEGAGIQPEAAGP